MKKTLLFGLALLPGLALGTNYFIPGTVWEVNHVGSSSPEMEIDLVEYFLDNSDVEGELTINLRDPNFAGDVYETLGNIKCEGEKVWYRAKEDSADKWTLLYDFGIQVGEKETFTLPASDGVYQWGEYTAEAECFNRTEGAGEGVFIMSFNLIYLTQGDMDQPEHGLSETWIEGIGSTRGVMANMMTPLDGVASQLLRVRHNDQLIYDIAATGVSAPEKPAFKVSRENGALRVSGLNAGERVVLYSVDGKCLATAVSAGGDLLLESRHKGVALLRAAGSTRKVVL